MSGTGQNGLVNFVASIDMTGHFHSSQDWDAVRRLACFYYACALSDASIAQAYDALTDIYEWQIKQEQFAPKMPAIKNIQVKGVNAVTHTPFSID